MDGQMVSGDAVRAKSPAEILVAALRELADSVELNCVQHGKAFGGCYLLAAPGEPAKSGLSLDSDEDAVQFWATIKAKADIAARELASKERSQMAFGNR